jgi:hypothetical protein
MQESIWNAMQQTQVKTLKKMVGLRKQIKKLVCSTDTCRGWGRRVTGFDTIHCSNTYDVRFTYKVSVLSALSALEPGLLDVMRIRTVVPGYIQRHF